MQNKRDTEHTLDFGTSASGIQLNPQQNKDSIGCLMLLFAVLTPSLSVSHVLTPSKQPGTQCVQFSFLASCSISSETHLTLSNTGSSDLGKLQTLLEEMEREKQNAGAEHDILRSHIVSLTISPITVVLSLSML